ncbi:Filamentation induced by cAMP death on curing [Fusarium albosuccineum]|uniref:Filamentation induced by cAMP death on curing n=1 Tax=Fusarium albosuccineum TaxID=1237068 RepID=A0A8H4L5B8_9HYPO|nr:Filamentation induced by cAMP death on curing [Fusarium albosuccineum]
MERIPATQWNKLLFWPDPVYRTSEGDEKTNPKTLFFKAWKEYDLMQRWLYDGSRIYHLFDELNDLMMYSIYGSNRIEHAGFDQEATFYLCRLMIEDEPVPAFDGRPEDKDGLERLFAVDESLRKMPLKDVLRRGREVVQHVKAFQHLVQYLGMAECAVLTQELIKDTHKILCDGIPIVDEDLPDVPSEKYAGRYRDVPVCAGSTMFVMPKHIPRLMRELCKDFVKDIDSIQHTLVMDPFAMAAKYSFRFVDIHPFQDGNGRMCRLILNVILFRYLDILLVIGATDEDIKEYIGIKKRASMEMEGHGEYATFVLRRAHKTLRRMKENLKAGKEPVWPDMEDEPVESLTKDDEPKDPDVKDDK